MEFSYFLCLICYISTQQMKRINIVFEIDDSNLTSQQYAISVWKLSMFFCMHSLKQKRKNAQTFVLI